jgi:hypothetical protein
MSDAERRAIEAAERAVEEKASETGAAKAKAFPGSKRGEPAGPGDDGPKVWEEL